MTPIGAEFRTETFDPDQLISGDNPSNRGTPATITDGEVVVRGHIMGITLATGKWLISLNAATDGSEVPRGVAVEAISPSGSDGESLVFTKGEFNQDKVTFGAGQTLANTKTDLQDVGIYLVDPVTKTPV